MGAVEFRSFATLVRRSMLWAIKISSLSILGFLGIVCVGIGVLMLLDGVDSSTRANASAIEVAVDPTLSDDGAAPSGRSHASDQSFEYDVNVSSQSLPDGGTYVQVREWREDGFVVELWISDATSEAPAVEALVHYSEDSGCSEGRLHDLEGSIRMRQAKSGSLLIEYELNGTQRGRQVSVSRTIST